MSAVANILKKNAGRSNVQGIPGRKLNAPVKTSRFNEKLGIEIELEGSNLPSAGYVDGVLSDSGSRWDVKADGSLRNGLEYVLNKPCYDNEVEGLIRGLFDVFDRRGTVLKPSNRCSLHVHYNVGGLKVNALTSLIALWTIFEEPLLRWWGDARFRNHFCLSSKDEASNLRAWQHFLTTGQLPEETALRYTSLNLVAIRKYGSVEFRGGGAIESPEQAILWVRFLHRLCEYAQEKYPNPQQLAYDLSERGAAQMLEDICGEEFAEFYQQVIRTVDDFNRCCADSFYNFQPIIFGFPWGDWLESIDKAYVPDPFAKPAKAAAEPRPVATWATTRQNVVRQRAVRFNENTGQIEEI